MCYLCRIGMCIVRLRTALFRKQQTVTLSNGSVHALVVRLLASTLRTNATAFDTLVLFSR